MRTLEEYMALPYRMEVIKDIYEGGYVASFPELPGCLTCADSIEELMELAEDAKRVWLDDMIERGLPINEPRSLESYSGCYKLRMPKSLHKELLERSKEEGVSMNQYCVYLLSKNTSTQAVP